MMPGVGFEEMILLVVMAIIVVGPKDLPLMMRKFGRFTGKMRAMAFEFKQGIDELGRQAEFAVDDGGRAVDVHRDPPGAAGGQGVLDGRADRGEASRGLAASGRRHAFGCGLEALVHRRSGMAGGSAENGRRPGVAHRFGWPRTGER